ncbi:MAG: minor capsid protein [Thermodesulfobacteriota bacterium]
MQVIHVYHHTGQRTGFTLNTVLRRDPTRTTSISKRFSQEFGRRFRWLKGEIRKAVIDQDCFGLSGSSFPMTLAAPSPRQFDFPRLADKVEAFMEWLKEQERAGILEVTQRPGFRRISVEEPWTNIYLRHAYQRGIVRARQELRKAGYDVLPIELGTDEGDLGLRAAFNQPFHADRVGLIYTRAYSELKGITEAMDQAISRVLADDLATGLNPRQLAREITKKVDGIGLSRAKTLARTEVVRAHHVANIAEYRLAGAEGVEVQAEWLTAGYNVCPRCASRQGKVYSLDEIEPLIPQHPNCRCVALPKPR